MRKLLLAVFFAVPVVAAPAADKDEAKGKDVTYDVYDAYFEKNDSGLKGDATYLVFQDKASFDKVFGLAKVMGDKKKSLPADVFKTKMVLALIKRGDKVWTYKVEKVTADGDTLSIQYEATPGEENKDAKFALPLILAVNKKKYQKMSFIENGKEVGGVKALEK